MYFSVGGDHLSTEKKIHSVSEITASATGTLQDKSSGRYIPGRKSGMEVPITDACRHVTDLKRGRSLDTKTAVTELFHRVGQDDLPLYVERGDPEANVGVGERFLTAHLRGPVQGGSPSPVATKSDRPPDRTPHPRGSVIRASGRCLLSRGSRRERISGAVSGSIISYIPVPHSERFLP